MPEQDMSESTRKFWFYLSIMTIVAGVAFYWFWGLMFGTWLLFETQNVGAYSITVLLIAFGVIGALLTRKKQAVA